MSTSRVLWTVKYRPKKIDDLMIDDGIKIKLQKIISEKNMPNIIFTGTPGVGKTSTIHCISKLILGDKYSEGVLELNASDDRGIKSVQESITNFCKKSINDKFNHDDDLHKIVILDEADNMTKKAQQLISNLMGDYNTSTRFAFTCNESSDIIEAIQSRCIIVRFKRLTSSQIVSKLIKICELENVEYSKKALNEISIISNGDMRQAINNLQIIHNAFGKVSTTNMFEICDRPHPTLMIDLFKKLINGNLDEALLMLEEIKDKGYSGSDILISMKNTLKTDTESDIEEANKIKIIKMVNESMFIVSHGLDTWLQLVGCVSNIYLSFQ